jgi:uridine phosphorylase
MLERGLMNQNFGLLKLKRDLSGHLVTYVRTDLNPKIIDGIVPVTSIINRSAEYPILGCEGGVSFLETGSGAPSVLTALYECSTFPIASIVRVGACGGLNGVEVGQLVLVESSLCMDAVSKKLCKTRVVGSDGSLVSDFSQKLSSAGFDCVVGSCASINSMYMFEADIEKARRMGATCWDLETATVLAFGKRFRIPAAAVLYTVSNGGDNPDYPPLPHTEFVKAVVRVLRATRRKNRRNRVESEF